MGAAGNGNPCGGQPEIIERLEALVGQEHVSEEYVRFRIDLLKAQWAVCEALAAASPAPEATGRRHAEQDSHSQTAQHPILDSDAVPLDRSLLESLFAALREALAKLGRESADASRLAAAAEAEPALLEELAYRAAFGPDQGYLDSLSRRLDVSVEALLFFGRSLAAPFVHQAAGRTKPSAGRMADTSRPSGRCPICGSPPALAKLRCDDGKRILCCSLCGAEWPFPRLECPHCGNRDQQALHFVRTAKTDPRWIETCDQCKGYIKTVDARKLPVGQPVIPVLEDTATLHLDMLAEKEGGIRRLPYAAPS